MQLVDIARRRLVAQGLVRPGHETPTEIVARLGAVQAQDWWGAKWALGLRNAGITDTVAEQALTEGAVLRTHVLRPTWHLVAPADIRWLLALTGPRVQQGNAGPYRQVELDAATRTRSRRALERALRDGRALTREALVPALARAGIDASDGRRLGYLLMDAELEGVVCSGPREGKQFTWALLEERVPPAPRSAPDTRDAMLAGLARRYFGTRGPATAQDFAMWSGLTVTDARRGAQAAEGATGLARLTIGDAAHWTDARADDTVVPVTKQATQAHLLPNYDEYFIGLRDRAAILVALRAAGASLDNVALSGHLFTAGGQVLGGWRRGRRAGGVAIEVTPLVTPTPAQRKALAAAVAALGAFMDVPATLAMPDRSLHPA
jgi:hypothetical protein